MAKGDGIPTVPLILNLLKTKLAVLARLLKQSVKNKDTLLTDLHTL